MADRADCQDYIDMSGAVDVRAAWWTRVALNELADIRLLPDGESVTFEFSAAEGGRRVAFDVGYDQLDRLSDLVAKAIALRDEPATADDTAHDDTDNAVGPIAGVWPTGQARSVPRPDRHIADADGA